jgi:4-amino-4-deoxy-L-arabinose transferase-like glycosyltransferase
MWHAQVVGIINALLTLFAVVLGVVAFIHCATQRSDAFPAVGTLQKAAWLAIIGVATVMTLLTNTRFLLFHMITIGAAALYLLDVRPGLKDATNGNGNW